MLDLTARISEQVEQEARRVELDGRDRAHGGLIPGDRAAEEARRSAKGWGPYRPEVTALELRELRTDTFRDFDRVTLQRLAADCRHAVRRFAPAWKRERAATLADDALLLLIRWPTHGRETVLDLGGEGNTPRRADWMIRDDSVTGRAPRWRLTDAAWHALRAAVKQASRASSERELDAVEATEVPTEALDIARLVEDEQRSTGAPTRLPDDAAPEVIASAMDIPLDAARAIVARAYPAASSRDLAASWGIGEGAAKNALTRGARAIRERFPDPADLLDALDDAAGAWRRETETRAILTLIDHRDGTGSADSALDAVRDWRGCTDTLPLEARALLAATRAALRRAGATYGSARAEVIARSIPRLLHAEQRRGRADASAARASHLSGRTLTMAPTPSHARPRALTRAERIESYRLEATTERAAHGA